MIRRWLLPAVVAALVVLGTGGVKATLDADCYAGVEDSAGMEGIDQNAPSSPPANGDCLYWRDGTYDDGGEPGCMFFRGDMDYAAEYRVSGHACGSACTDQCGGSYTPGSEGVTDILVVASLTSGDLADGNGTLWALAYGICHCYHTELDAAGPRVAFDNQQAEPEIVYLERPAGRIDRERGDDVRPFVRREHQITVTGKVRNPGAYILASGDSVNLDRLMQRAVLLPDAEHVEVVGQGETRDGAAITFRRAMSRELLAVTSLLPQRVPRVFPGDRVVVR